MTHNPYFYIAVMMIEELMAQTAGLLGDGDFWEKKSVFLGRTSDKGE